MSEQPDLWLCHMCGRKFGGNRDTCADCYRTTCADCFDTSNGAKRRKCKECARGTASQPKIGIEE